MIKCEKGKCGVSGRLEDILAEYAVISKCMRKFLTDEIGERATDDMVRALITLSKKGPQITSATVTVIDRATNEIKEQRRILNDFFGD